MRRAEWMLLRPFWLPSKLWPGEQPRLSVESRWLAPRLDSPACLADRSAPKFGLGDPKDSIQV